MDEENCGDQLTQACTWKMAFKMEVVVMALVNLI